MSSTVFITPSSISFRITGPLLATCEDFDSCVYKQLDNKSRCLDLKLPKVIKFCLHAAQESRCDHNMAHTLKTLELFNQGPSNFLAAFSQTIR